LEYENRTLRIAEQHQLQQGEEMITAYFAFALRCRLQKNLYTPFVQAGFGAINYFSISDSHRPVGATDRIVAVAHLVSVPTESS
jgi:hypothetical protein